MKHIPLFVFLAVHTSLFGAAQSGRENLIRDFQRLELEFGGHLGVMAKNLDTGETVGFNATERFPTASAIKLPVMAAFFDLADRKQIDPAARVVLAPEDKKPGSGILQMIADGANISLLDAVRLMIVLSDNTATNLVLDRLAPTHAERLACVNDFLQKKGLKNTRLLNRLYSPATKQQTPEAIRYGIGVSTPEDMVKLITALHSKTLVEGASCETMLTILKQQFYEDMIPRFLPRERVRSFEVAHKTGSINETKVDVGLVLTDKVNMALAVFVDKHPDHSDMVENRALLLGARVSRAVWDYFAGTPAAGQPPAFQHDVDWNTVPGGRWAIYRSPAAPFPHKSREEGYKAGDGTYYPYHPHYDDNSLIVVVPQGYAETPDGANVIVHFHGHMNDNLGAMEQFGMLQGLLAQNINALLVLAQGPFRSRDSSGGKMEDEAGLRNLVEDVLSTMKGEGVVKNPKLGRLIVSAHSGGYRPAAFSLEKGGLAEKVTDVFLFDALYAQQDLFLRWLNKGRGRIFAAYTDHLAKEHTAFERTAPQESRSRLVFTPAAVSHDEVIQAYFEKWLARLDRGWKK